MPFIAEMGNFFLKLSLRSPQDSKLVSAHPKADVSFGAAAEFFAVLFRPCWSSDALQGHKGKSGNDERWISPVFPYTVSCHWVLSELRGVQGRPFQFLKHNWSQSHHLLCGKMCGQILGTRCAMGFRNAMASFIKPLRGNQLPLSCSRTNR